MLYSDDTEDILHTSYFIQFFSIHLKYDADEWSVMHPPTPFAIIVLPLFNDDNVEILSFLKSILPSDPICTCSQQCVPSPSDGMKSNLLVILCFIQKEEGRGR